MYPYLHPYPLHLYPPKSYVSRHKHMKKSVFYRLNIIRNGGSLEQYSFTVVLGNIHLKSKLAVNLSIKS